MVPSVTKDGHEMRQWKRPSKKAKLASTTQEDDVSVPGWTEDEERWEEQGESEI